MQAFTARFQKERKSPCDDVPATVAWLKAQPEVSFAWGQEDGHSFNYEVKGFDNQPLVFMCHRRR